MPMPEPLTTTLSTRGQVILPKPIRRRLRWVAGTRLDVESTANGVLLKPEPSLPETRPEYMFARPAYDGPPKSLQEREAGGVVEARRRHEGD